MKTDTELLDFLQKLNNEARYTGRAILRLSFGHRGWRLHETTLPGASLSVRRAIEKFMDEYEKGKK